MRRSFLVLLAVLAIATAVQIEGCTGQAIDFPLIDQEPDLVETVLNGKKFTVGKLLILGRL